MPGPNRTFAARIPPPPAAITRQRRELAFPSKRGSFSGGGAACSMRGSGLAFTGKSIEGGAAGEQITPGESGVTGSAAFGLYRSLKKIAEKLDLVLAFEWRGGSTAAPKELFSAPALAAQGDCG